eukprot:7548411-Alexandrium_andersonii.AAC.1
MRARCFAACGLSAAVDPGAIRATVAWVARAIAPKMQRALPGPLGLTSSMGPPVRGFRSDRAGSRERA